MEDDPHQVSDEVSAREGSDRYDSQETSDGISRYNVWEDEPDRRPEEVSVERKRGKKSAREERITDEERWRAMLQMMETLTEERREDRRQSQAIIGNLQKKLEEARSETSERGSSQGVSGSRELHLLVKERQRMETSVGEWKSDLLEQVELPSTWPKYEWPKAWAGRTLIQRALITLNEMQKEKTLKEALNDLKNNAQRLSRNLHPGDYRIIAPILEGSPSTHTHDAWEMCLLGIPEFPPGIALLLFTCRNVKPAYLSNINGWNEVVAGGQWPSTVSKGFKVGRNQRVGRKPSSRPTTHKSLPYKSHPTKQSPSGPVQKGPK